MGEEKETEFKFERRRELVERTDICINLVFNALNESLAEMNESLAFVCAIQIKELQ